MPIILPKHQTRQRDMLRDVRPVSERFMVEMAKPAVYSTVAVLSMGLLFFADANFRAFADIIGLFLYKYFRWVIKRPFIMPYKCPRYANMPDPHNPPPGKSKGGKSDGILYLGNVRDPGGGDDDEGREVWLTNNDVRTHILYIGTTGSGKTEGLKGMVTNALCWGSGFAYTDGKADTDLWASLYSLARRFGRDDDILVLNYMTGNSDDGSTSNSMNPFSNGSASYLANLVSQLMPEAGADNAMWKERAVALMFALMPALTFKRDKQGMLLDIGVVRDHLELKPIIRLSRDKTLPDRILHGLKGYLDTLPGYIEAAFDDEGNERPPSPDQPMYDLQVARQQHGYLSMQFTRAMQSMADEYGYIFKAQLADVEVLDVVLNRRILVVLIPALEKSGDEAANLGKIVAACFKGMMGATLGSTVEGAWESAIGTKQTYSSSSFMTVFDEVGYYTAAGMAVMAAQARSLGFSLVFATQDIPSMEKRIKQEAKSIAGNCNLKVIGRLEDPTDTKTFIEAHAGTSWVQEAKGFEAPTNTISSLFFTLPFYDSRGTSYQLRTRMTYDHCRSQREGEAHLLFSDWGHRCIMFFAATEKSKALRVQRFLPVPGVTKATEARDRIMLELEARLKDKEWTADEASGPAKETPEIAALVQTIAAATEKSLSPIEMSAASVAAVADLPPDTSGATRAAAAAASNEDEGFDRPLQTAYGGSGYADDMSAEERAAMRGSLPPLYEGDQFEIEDVDILGDGGVLPEQLRVPGDEMDMETVIPDLDEEDIPDYSEVKLPEEIQAFLAHEARQLNEGLKGKSE